MADPVRICKDGHAIETFDDWFRHAPPRGGKAHWVEGRSALECARAWCGESGGPRVPGEILELLASHEDTKDYRVACATPEYKSCFDDLTGEPRNADLVAVARKGEGDVLVISIEAKADEAFDNVVCDVLADVVDRVAHGERSNLVLRIQQLAGALLPPFRRGLPRLGALRYQLLTAAAGALGYAREVGARGAVLIVHEFITNSTDDRLHASNAADLDRFVQRLSGGERRDAPVGQLLGPFTVPGAPLFDPPVSLYVGKVQRMLRRPGGSGSVVTQGGGAPSAPTRTSEPASSLPSRVSMDRSVAGTAAPLPGARMRRPPRPPGPTAIVDNQDLIAQLKRAYPTFSRRNADTGRAIWVFLRSRGARKLDGRGSGPTPARASASHLRSEGPKSAAQFEVPVEIWDELYDFLDQMGAS